MQTAGGVSPPPSFASGYTNIEELEEKLEEKLLNDNTGGRYGKAKASRGIELAVYRFLYGEVNGELAKQIVQQIAEFRRQWIENGIPESEREIVVRINSPGGSVVDGYAILDNLKATCVRVITVAEGIAASMGAFLLSVAGTKGARLAFQNAEILIHQPLGGAQGQATELEIVVARMLKVKRRLNYLMSEATGKSVQEIEAATDRDHFLTAEEALAFGLIDQIIE